MYAQRLYSHHMALTSEPSSNKLGSEELIKNSREKLREFLSNDTQFDQQRILETIQKSSLFPEMVILYSRLGLHKQVLQTYIFDLNDIYGAEKYCLDHGNNEEKNAQAEDIILQQQQQQQQQQQIQTQAQDDTPTRGELFLILLRIYLEDPRAAPVKESGLSHLLAYCSEYLDPIESLKIIPDDTSLDALNDYLEGVLRSCVSRRRSSQILSKLVRAERFQTQVQLLETKRQAFTIDTKTECAVCRKKIGDSYFSALPPRGGLYAGRLMSSSGAKWVILHKGCCKKYFKLRDQGESTTVGSVMHVK